LVEGVEGVEGVEEVEEVEGVEGVFDINLFNLFNSFNLLELLLCQFHHIVILRYRTYPERVFIPVLKEPVLRMNHSTP
jgi:hypothetical protein